MRSLLNAMFVLGAASMGFTSVSANEVEGKVESITVRASDGLHYVVIEGPISGRAACATNTTYYMIADEHSDVGKNQLAILISAYMAGKSVLISGSGSCTRWSDGEDISFVMLR